MPKYIANPAIPSSLAPNLEPNPRANSSRGLYLIENPLLYLIEKNTFVSDRKTPIFLFANL